MRAQSGKPLPRLKPGDRLEERDIVLITTAFKRIRSQLGFDCTGPLCICVGDDDCNDLFGTDLCGDGICFVGNDGSVVCICLRNR